MKNSTFSILYSLFSFISLILRLCGSATSFKKGGLALFGIMLSLKIFLPDVASAKKVHVETQCNLIGSVLIGKNFVVGKIHGKPDAQVVVHNPLAYETQCIYGARHQSEP